MNLPTERITINDKDFALLKPGLDFLVAGIATYRADGSTPRSLYENVMTPAKFSYRLGSYVEHWADCVVSARSKVMGRGSSRKVRLNAFETRALALALRLQKRIPQRMAAGAGAKLEARLENLRRRADRRTKQVNADMDVLFANARWANFCGWVRGQLMFKWPRKTSPALKAIRADKRERLRSIIAQTLESRRHAALSEGDTKRAIHLLTEEFRRKRHEHTMLEFLGLDALKAQAYLFPRLGKKLQLVALDGAEKNWCVTAAERGDKCRDRSYRAAPKQEAPVANASRQATSPQPTSAPTAISNPAPLEQALKIRPDRQHHPAVAVVADWLTREVPSKHWSLLNQIAPNLQESRNSIFSPGTELAELIATTQPARRLLIAGLAPRGQEDHIEFDRFYQWAGAFLVSFFRNDRGLITEVFQDAYQLALDRNALSTQGVQA